MSMFLSMWLIISLNHLGCYSGLLHLNNRGFTLAWKVLNRVENTSLVLTRYSACNGLFNEVLSDKFFRGALESFLTWNITNWHGLCAAQDRRALQRVIETAQNIISTHLSSYSDTCEVRWGEVSKPNPKDTERPYPLLYQQTTEQLLSSDSSVHPLHSTINKK